MVVHVGKSRKAGSRAHHLAQVICVTTEPHTKRGGRKGQTAGSPVDRVFRIATNLLVVPAEVIADIDNHRWTVELFFHFFKHHQACRDLVIHQTGWHRDPKRIARALPACQ